MGFHPSPLITMVQDRDAANLEKVNLGAEWGVERVLVLVQVFFSPACHGGTDVGLKDVFSPRPQLKGQRKTPIAQPKIQHAAGGSSELSMPLEACQDETGVPCLVSGGQR